MVMKLDQSIWENLPKSFIGLSPMDGVTDVPFREICQKYGQPDLMFTEFSSVEGLCRKAVDLLKEFRYLPSQRPIIGQIYGVTPEFFRQSAIMLCELGFDGIDINMGCPAKNVAHGGAGAALIKTPVLAQAIIKATQVGAAQWAEGAELKDCLNLSDEIKFEVTKMKLESGATQLARRNIPISIKTRIGVDSIVIENWLKTLLELEPAAITIHGRTLRQLYSGQADWDAIGLAVNVAKNSGAKTKILGNGDLTSRVMALEKIQEFGVAGVLIGRASFGNPWIFSADQTPQSPELKAKVALEHAELFEKTYGQAEKYSFLPMRKHLSWYTSGFPQAREIRSVLVRSNSSAEAKSIFQRFGLLLD